MKRILVLAVFFSIMKSMTVCPALWAGTTFVTIGTGGITGVYYPAGRAIAKMVSNKQQKYGIRATAEITPGSVYNINAIVSGDMAFGIVQSDRQFQALHGQAEWADKGPQKDLRAVFSLHSEVLTLVATVASGIITVCDLKGKRVNIGEPGSGQRQNAIDALMAVGIVPEKDLKAEGFKSSEAPGLLQEGRLDAFFYTVGHPSSALREATAGLAKVRFVPLTGPEIEDLVREKPFYAKCAFPAKMYPGVANEEENIETFGVRAALCSSVKVPEDAVYAVTKAVFDNIGEFRKLHPALGELDKKEMLEGLLAPLHPGAEKYFRQSGLLKQSGARK
ncbi:MAG: TAXI family TRAP transporter solute-binding subunit [Desulfobacterales bacterium]